MKKSYIVGLSALAAALLLGSCAKENGAIGTASGGTHSYTISFADPTTKTVLDKGSLTPHFCDGDQIIISNGENCEKVPVSVDDKGIATVKTSLEGDLIAVYPPKAAWMRGNEILNVNTPSLQDGTFESAHTAIAHFNSKETYIKFSNGAALFSINLPEGARKLTIQSLPVKYEGYSVIAGICDGDGFITVGDGTTELPSPCIVAVGFGAKLSRLSFDVKFTEENDGTGALLGISTRDIQKAGIEDRVSERMFYSIGGNGKWHPYVEIDMEGRTYKWATMNVGALRESDSGEYFMWGGTTGYPLGADSLFQYPFIGSNAPYVTKAEYVDGEPGHWECTYSKYNEDGKSTLELCDDAANANWGGPWRMPTEIEAKMLSGLRTENAVVDGVSGYYLGTASSRIFLPFKGMADGSMLSDRQNGYIWTASGYEPGTKVCFSYPNGGGANLPPTYRYLGLPVRAIAE